MPSYLHGHYETALHVLNLSLNVNDIDADIIKNFTYLSIVINDKLCFDLHLKNFVL